MRYQLEGRIVQEKGAIWQAGDLWATNDRIIALAESIRALVGYRSIFPVLLCPFVCPIHQISVMNIAHSIFCLFLTSAALSCQCAWGRQKGLLVALLPWSRLRPPEYGRQQPFHKNDCSQIEKRIAMILGWSCRPVLLPLFFCNALKMCWEIIGDQKRITQHYNTSCKMKEKDGSNVSQALKTKKCLHFTFSLILLHLHYIVLCLFYLITMQLTLSNYINTCLVKIQ